MSTVSTAENVALEGTILVDSLRSRVRPPQDLATFNAIQLDQEIGTLTWPNGADFDPATLHDWPEECDKLAGRVKGGRIQYRTNGGPTREWSRRAAELCWRAAHSQR